MIAEGASGDSLRLVFDPIEACIWQTVPIWNDLEA